MTELETALKRLDAALDSAEAAVNRALDAADAARAREEELTAFSDDRARLAELLDRAAVQSAASDDRDREIARRVDVAIDAVQDALAGSEA